MTLIAAVISIGAFALTRSSPPGGPVSVSDAVVGANGSDVVAAYLVIRNPGPADELVGVSSPDADHVTMHFTRQGGGLSAMEDASTMEVPADGVLRLDPGGSHLMVEETHVSVTAGTRIRLHLDFERSGGRDVVAIAVPLAELPDRIPR